MKALFVAHRQMNDTLRVNSKGSAPPWEDTPACSHLWLSGLRNVHAGPPGGRIDILTFLAAYNRRSAITVTWKCVYAVGPTAYAETQIILFYHLPLAIKYGVCTHLHNEPGSVFRF